MMKLLCAREVRESDRDCYMCQINTEKMKKQVGCVEVQVPPEIDNSVTSSDLSVTEGGNVTLSCVAHGQPSPTVTWKREDQLPIKVNTGRKSLHEWTGSQLVMTNVRRTQMGALLCIARNQVPPAVSKRIVLSVNFRPQVTVDNQLVGSPLGQEVEIKCFIQAFPMAITHWQRRVDGREIILMNVEKNHEVTETMDGYKTTSILRIRNFSLNDAGPYECVSTNSLGRADHVIRIYEIKRATDPPRHRSDQATTHRYRGGSSTSRGYNRYEHDRNVNQGGRRQTLILDAHPTVEGDGGNRVFGKITIDDNSHSSSTFYFSSQVRTFPSLLLLLLPLLLCLNGCQ